MNNPNLHESINNYIIKPETILKINEKVLGPVRFCDVYPFRRINIDNEEKLCLIVSNRTHKVLQKFKIIDCEVVPVKLMYKSKWYGNDTMGYWLYKFRDFEKGNNILAGGTIMKKPWDRSKMNFQEWVKGDEISDPKFIKAYINSNNKYNDFGPLEYKLIHFNEKIDLFYNGLYLLASKEFVETIKTLKISGFEFSKYYNTQFKFKNSINDHQDRRLKLLLNTVGTTNPLLNQKSLKKYYKIKDEVLKMENYKDDIANYLSKKYDVNLFDSLLSKLYSFQITNNVVLPDFYINAIKNPNFRTLKTRGNSLEHWDVLPIERVQIIDKEWVETTPQLFRAVVIAENGLGDYIIMLRKQSSSYEISGKFYALWHETGEIEEVEIVR